MTKLQEKVVRILNSNLTDHEMEELWDSTSVDGAYKFWDEIVSANVDEVQS